MILRELVPLGLSLRLLLLLLLLQYNSSQLGTWLWEQSCLPRHSRSLQDMGGSQLASSFLVRRGMFLQDKEKGQQHLLGSNGQRCRGHLLVLR